MVHVASAVAMVTSSAVTVGSDPRFPTCTAHGAAGNLVAVVVEMEQALGAGGDGFLEQHDALIGLVAEKLQGREAAGRPHVEMLSSAGGYDKAFGCVHAGVLPCPDSG